MKTRSNMPLFVLEVSDVKALSNSQIDLLRCGDWLVKKDASGEHPYQVTFKKEGVGMCLTYHDASVIETQSYDWNNSLKKWVYNSEDKTPNLLDAQTEDDVLDIIQDTSNFGDLSKTWNGSTGSLDSTGLTLTGKYVKAVRNFNELQFIFNCRISNTSGSSITISDDSIFSSYFLPDDILSKIYGHNGVSVLNSESNISIAYSTLFISNTGGGPSSSNMPRYLSLFWIKASKEIRYYLAGGALTIADGQTLDFEARISLAL